MFQGYLKHSGVEIFNSKRTRDYAANMVPGLSFSACWDDDDLGCLLGDGEYRTPALDQAPWFSESRPGSAKFLGLYPLEVMGIEDSSRSMKVTELVEDGAVFSLPRRASKEFRVRGLMMAVDGQGLDAGMRWLRGALEAKDCTRCAGDQQNGFCAGHDAEYLAYLPSCCDYSDFPVRPVNWSYTPGQTDGWVNYGEGRVSAQTNGVRVIMPCNGDGAQWYATNLIPGQTYRLKLNMRSPVEMTVSVSGRETITARREDVQGTLTRTPWVIDFVARGETEAIKVYQASGGCIGARAVLQDLRIDRIAERSKIFEPRFFAGATAEAESWTWEFLTTPVEPDVFVMTASPGDVEAMSFEMDNPSGSTLAVGEGSGPQRVIRGLRTGENYTVYVKVQVSGGVPAPRPIIVGETSTFTALGNNWYSVAFTATNPAHYMRLAASADFTIPGTSTATILLNYLRVDLDVSGQVLGTPDQSRDAVRELHGVELLGGPNVIDIYRTTAPAVMVEVEFTMAVARPYTYSSLYQIPPSPSATTNLVPTGDCTTPVVPPLWDPDCEPVPVAPQPPSIEPDCVRTVTEWRRYWTEVPPELAGGWAESVPVITLTTGDDPVRDVRIRFYPNPSLEEVDDLDQCSYCGEFYISYVPPDSVFTIDAIDRTALASVDGAPDIRVMHLVSDINYGPIQWPEMSCDIPYYVTVDIAPDEILDLNIDIAVALKE